MHAYKHTYIHTYIHIYTHNYSYDDFVRDVRFFDRSALRQSFGVFYEVSQFLYRSTTLSVENSMWVCLLNNGAARLDVSCSKILVNEVIYSVRVQLHCTFIFYCDFCCWLQVLSQILGLGNWTMPCSAWNSCFKW